MSNLMWILEGSNDRSRAGNEFLVRNDDKISLLDRQHDNFKGCIPPGGKVELPESTVEVVRKCQAVDTAVMQVLF